MSNVTGVVLCTSCVESEGEGTDPGPGWRKLNEWLIARHFGPLRFAEHCAGGTKHPQMCVGIGGYNFFPAEEFAAFVLSLDWDEPTNVVLTLQPEEGPTRIVRPADA